MSNAMYLGTTIDNPPVIAADRPAFDAALAARATPGALRLDLLDDLADCGLDIPGFTSPILE